MWLRVAFVFSLVICSGLAKAEPAAAASPAPAPASPSDNPDLYQSAKQLFDQYAPPEVKAQYEFPSKEQFDRFLSRVQQAVDSGSFEELGSYAPQAQLILAALRTMPDQAGTADWLAARLDEIEEAKEIDDASKAPPAANPGPAIPPAETRASEPAIPYYNRWLQRMSGRPLPANAGDLMPQLRRAFAAEGVPPELAWLAEVESSLNPSAESPSGARGLFQLKAETARDLGLSTFLPDERTDPEKSAHAAARDLRALGEKFGSWPLALAAYNAGEGRVSRLLESRHARDFAGVASALPAGTRMYVPEVCALVALRTGVTPDRIPPPR
jgi:membrane-bound lytic murein transglycosylase D